MTALPAVAAYAFAAATVGTMGGLGGAVLLVPVLVVAGVEPAAAAPVGLLTVVAGSLAASSAQIDAGLVHHRLGILTETAASAGAMAGAALAGAVSEGSLRAVLVAVALLGAVLVVIRRPGVPQPHPAFAAEAPGEWPGTLAGAAPAGGTVEPYEARRPAAGVGLMAGAGLVAGVSGVSGGYLRTPLLTHVMDVPPRVAAATTTFTVGVTASSALLVFIAGGHVDLHMAAAAVAGALPGGRAGALLQARVPVRALQAVLGAALVGVAVAMAVTG